MKVYHYTSIETLALILKNKSIRFNRLDCVDDLEESIYGSGEQNVNLAKYTFVSCWTRDNVENLALWKMYTNNKGVRIGLDENPFVSYAVNKNFVSYFQMPLEAKGDYVAIPFNNEIKLYDIKYVDNQHEKIKTLIDNKGCGIAINTGDLGLYKDSRWQFQQESRYKIILYPINETILKKTIGKSGNPNFDIMFGLIESLGPSILTQSPLEETDFYINLTENSLEHIEIMMGPETSDAEKYIVEKLLAEFPQSSLTESYFKGKIKSKK